MTKKKEDKSGPHDLLAQGCRQGALLETAGLEPAVFSRANNEWILERDGCIEALIVVSQDCDIAAVSSMEPHIEAIEVRESTNPSEIAASRKGNSARLYFLDGSPSVARVATARRRVLLRKDALDDVSFEEILRGERARSLFSDWVASRYSRPAIPDLLVDFVQRPIIKAYEKLRKSRDPRLAIIDGVNELRLLTEQPDRSLDAVDLIAIHSDAFSPDEATELATWLEGVLVVDGSPVRKVHLQHRTASTISLTDYLAATRLQLDHFSLEPR